LPLLGGVDAGDPDLVLGLGVVQKRDGVSVRDADNAALNRPRCAKRGDGDHRTRGERREPVTEAAAGHV
jgi:hypothetical protein